MIDLKNIYILYITLESVNYLQIVDCLFLKLCTLQSLVYRSGYITVGVNCSLSMCIVVDWTVCCGSLFHCIIV